MKKFFLWLHIKRQNKWVGLAINLVFLAWIVAVLWMLRVYAYEEPGNAVGIAFIFGILVAVPAKFSFSFEVRDPYEKDASNGPT